MKAQYYIIFVGVKGMLLKSKQKNKNKNIRSLRNSAKDITIFAGSWLQTQT